MSDEPVLAALARLEGGQAELRADVSGALGTINTVLGEIIEGMATRTQLDALMKRMNDGFERVLLAQHVLQVNDDTLTQRVTRLEEDVRQLRGSTP
jgi:hypothetical protein